MNHTATTSLRTHSALALSTFLARPPLDDMAVRVCSTVSDAGFVTLHNAFRASGGLASGDEVAVRMNVAGEGGYARLARRIVGRQVFSFAWNDAFWLPLFQFDTQNWSVRDGLRPVLSELLGVMDGWSIAVWFVQPNDELGGNSPLVLWETQPSAVFQAARLQRYALTA